MSAGARDMHEYGRAAAALWNVAVGDDWNGLTDPNRSIGERLLHAATIGAMVIDAPETLGLALATKTVLKGSVEQLTYKALGKAGLNGGKLLLEGGVRLTPAEKTLAADLVKRGDEVVARPASGVGRSHDFLVNGKPTELKTISNVKVDSTGEAITKTIREATKQAKSVIIDARGQRGLTETKARKAVQAAFDSTPKRQLQQIKFFGRHEAQAFNFTVMRSK
ncbi:MAG: hypothetical protein NVSMB64_19190 [Candidatus Velthaea sp.]